MTAKITYPIPVSNAEIITTAIADLLRVELANQYLLTNEEVFNCNVDDERFTPYSDTNGTNVTVHMGQLDIQNSNPEFELVRGNYYIRTSVRYTEEEDEEGSSISQKMAKRISMVIRYILMAKESLHINEAIESLKSSSIEMASPFREDTANNETASQVMFEVMFKEKVNDLPTFDLIGANLTTDKFKTIIE